MNRNSVQTNKHFRNSVQTELKKRGFRLCTNQHHAVVILTFFSSVYCNEICLVTMCRYCWETTTIKQTKKKAFSLNGEEYCATAERLSRSRRFMSMKLICEVALIYHLKHLKCMLVPKIHFYPSCFYKS